MNHERPLVTPEPWPVDAGPEFADLAARCFVESLSPAELDGVCWGSDVPRTVLSLRRSGVAVSAHGPTAAIDVLCVHPSERREGLGRELIEASARWAAAHGCTSIQAGGHPPFYLWTGIDRDWIPALSLFETSGFTCTGCVVNLTCSTGLVVEAPVGTRIVKPSRSQARAVLQLCADQYPGWVQELKRAIGNDHAFVAIDESTGGPTGFACHSVSRRGWFGPTAVFRDRSNPGTGSALLAATLGDLRRDGHERCEISWVGPIAFYAKVAGATAGRLFLTYRRSLDPADRVTVGP